jgi:hypothetical protein
MSRFRPNAYTRPWRLLALLAAAAAVLAAGGSPGGSPAGGGPGPYRSAGSGPVAHSPAGDVLMPAIRGGGRSRSLILTAMIFAVSMTFIDTVFLVMGGIMAAAAVVAGTGLRAGRQEEPGEPGTVPGSPAPHREAGVRP